MSEKFIVEGGLSIPQDKHLELAGTELSATATELNILQGTNTASSVTIVDADRLVLNDAGTMRQVAMSDFEVYFESAIDTLNNATSIGTSGTATTFKGTISAEEAVTLDSTLTVTGSAVLADGSQTASNAAPSNDKDIANKKYVDDQLSDSSLSAATDSGNMNPIDLDSETLTLTGGEAMDVTHSGNTITFAPELASETNLGVATFDGTDFSVTSGGDVTLNKDPIITIDGDVSGQATMTNLASATITTTIGANAVEMSMLSAGVLPTDITVASANIVNGTIVNADIANSTIANDKLANSSVSFGGVSLSLGGSDDNPAFDLSDATAYPGDSSLSAVGTVTTGTWNATAIATDYIADNAVTLAKLVDLTQATFILGAADGAPTAVSMSGDATMDNTGVVTIANGAVENSMLANSTLSAGGVEFTLGVSDDTPAFDLSDATSYPGDASLLTTGALSSGSISSGFGSIDIGTSTLDCGDISGDSITMTGFSVTGTGITTMLSGSQLSSDSASAVVANADIANKAYVDSVVTAADLDFTSDGGETFSIDLDSEVLDIAGGSNLTTSASGNEITVALDDDVTITGDMTSSTITNTNFTVNASGNTDIDGTLDVASTVNLAAADVATSVRGTLSVTQTLGVTGVATFTAESVHNGGIDCNGTLSMQTNAIEGTADNMLLFADDSSSSATEHSFANDDDGVLALQAADHVRSLNHIIPNADSDVNLGSSSKRWAEVHADKMEMEHSAKEDFSVSMTGSAVEVFNFTGHESCKMVIKVKDGSDITCKEVLAVNGTVVEYATVTSGTEVSMTIACTGTSITVNSADGSTAKGSVDLIN